MPHFLHHHFQRCLLCILAILLLLQTVTPAQAAAAHDPEQTAVIELTGVEANGKYELNADDLSLFSLEGIAPGDSMKSSVTVVNKSNVDMAVSVYSIQSTLEQDTALFDILDLKVSVAGEEAYHGKYAVGAPTVTDYYPIPSGNDLTFDIEVIFPSAAGNEYQGKQMDSTWFFDAVYYEPENDASGSTDPSDPNMPQSFGDDVIKTGMDLIGSNTALLTSLLVFLFAFIAAGITYVRYISANKAQQKWLNKNNSVDDDL